MIERVDLVTRFVLFLKRYSDSVGRRSPQGEAGYATLEAIVYPVGFDWAYFRLVGDRVGRILFLISVELPYKFASCPEQEALAPVKLPALPHRNDSVRSPLASRQWRHDLPATSAWPHDLISVTNGHVPVGR
jgi:hypothetical protein